MARRSIAYCECGNISVDGLNFKRVEDAAIPTLQCARCGAISSEFEYLNCSKVKSLVEALEEIVRIYSDDLLTNSAAQDRTDEIARWALKFFKDSQ